MATRYLRGGSERRIRDIVRAVPEAEHVLAVGSGSDVELAREQVGPAEIVVVPTLVRAPDPRRDLMALRHLGKLVAEGRYDLVITHQSKAGVLGRVAASRADVAALHSLSMANFGPGYGRFQSALFRRIEGRLVRRTTAYLVVGTDLARRYREIGARDDQLHVVRSGVPLAVPADRAAARSHVCDALGLPAGRPLVVYLGSLEARKNVLSLPALLSRLRSTTDVDPFMVLAGEGPLAPALQAELHARGLSDHARLVGFVEDPGTLVRAADAVVLLSSAEGVPQVLVQAAAAGTPFVAYDVDGVQELCALGADGAAVPLGEVDAAADALAALLEPGRIAPAATIDLSPWAPETIRDGYRRVIADALGQLEADDRSPTVGLVAP